MGDCQQCIEIEPALSTPVPAPANAQEYFIRLVDATVDTSVRHVRAFVRRYLAARLAEARAQIEGYGQRYADAMLAALDTHKQGRGLCSLP